MTSNFRSHQQFVDDDTDAYIVGTFLDNMNIEALSSVPKDLPPFSLMSLLLRDTIDSYKMGGGDRIVRNAYFEWLFASSLHHTKYTVWLWRMIAYVDAVLSPSESAEYT